MPGGRAAEISPQGINQSRLEQRSLGGEKMQAIRNFWKDEAGASAVEYGLLVALIAAVIIAAVTTLGTSISGKFKEASDGIAGAS